MSRWQTLKQRVLTRRLPHCLISWRFLLPGQGRAVQLHRKVLLGAWPVLPRWQWLLIFLYSAGTWWLFWGWLMLYRNLKRQWRRAAESEGVTFGRQLLGLMLATFAHGIAPRDYYRYGLYKRPERQWLLYIYEQELPHWHWLMSPELSEQSLHLMTDKHDFARAMVEQGIATVETIALLQQGDEVSEQQLFTDRSLFLKPRCGARAQGCMVLDYDADKERYRLQLQVGNERIEGRSAIIDHVRGCLTAVDYLVQPLLQNAPDLTAITGSDQLATLRVISALIDGVPEVLMANLELPAKQGGVRMLMVDVGQGSLMAAHPSVRDELSDLIGWCLPQWSKVASLCTNAHHHFEDLNAIGWDVVISNGDVKLLEGNINWGVAAHQVATGTAALESDLIRAYG
ncbi:sugar-transfer associated ATP-grasp domain-containing protein [Mariprofundus sp. KV]|uniref:sugar-transfer associated ATP-grasp domain-containing protein n=1 Tax=Mariprofundus sp. KV TaxID=2608715 RepID=UPI0015A0201D|nr:sugar-transfer associated ATP-grasp domain-containing protein [Mariprofundus sp. KV]NWF35527.1 hypothetical protein [Mariprofundus sp. KV]